MSELFEDAYSGEMLSVSYATDVFLRQHFPQVDARSAYRVADAYLSQCAPSKRPRNARKFLINWFRRENVATLRNAQAWREREDTLQRETAVGSKEIQ